MIIYPSEAQLNMLLKVFKYDDVVWTGSTARQLAESLSGLPLPEDYALQELRCLTR